MRQYILTKPRKSEILIVFLLSVSFFEFVIIEMHEETISRLNVIGWQIPTPIVVIITMMVIL